MAVRFGLLGDIAAWIDGRPVDLGHARQRCVLAGLLADVNQPVSTDQLAHRVWADRPPYQAHRSLASYLSRLRRSLADAEDVEILRAGSGYVIRVAPESIDLHRFRAMVAQARASPALELFDQALRLWRGDAFAGVNTPWCDSMRQTLNAERLAAELDRTDVALSLGEHNAMLSDISTRAAAYPFDERMAGQLMLALYRAGRQADALDHYQGTRRRLAEEFGADPGPALRELHRRILNADPELEPAVDVAVPRQLPAGPRWLVGRDRELSALTEAVDAGGAMAICAIGGGAGVGKTTLALRWAHDNIDRFPDGQLYVNLRGFDPSDSPMSPTAAVRRLLGALGVVSAALPADEEGQVALYRSLVANRRLLVLLDNARDTAQVEPLLPGSDTCTVLTTSRNHLAGLGMRGARLLKLGMLASAAARELLTCHLGARRIAEERDAVAELVRWCAGLPLAVSIVAARAAAQPGFPLAILAKELQDDSARLDALDAADPNVNLRAVFSWSYRSLEPASAQVFSLLGAMPGPDIGLPAATSLPGIDGSRALRVLVAAHVLDEHVPGRYRMHDLLRLYASELLDEATGAAATARLAGFYLRTSCQAARLLRPERSPLELEDGYTLRFPDRAAATAWFDVEHGCLLATLKTCAERGWHTSVWKLAWTLSAYHVLRGYLAEDLEAWRLGVVAAQKLAEPVTEAIALVYLGTAYGRVGSYDEAVDHLRRARALAESADDVTVLADVHRALGWVWGEQGDVTLALPHTHRALQLYRAAGNAMREADALNSAGWLHAHLGLYQRATDYCEQALVLCRQHDHRRGEAITLDSLGYIARQLGRHAQALTYYRDALTLVRAMGNTYDEADIQAGLGDAHHALGEPDLARSAWQHARALYRTQRRTRKAENLA
ncbi:DNA-binding SARP family transcriptional activator/Flp pilus assembly protein TadD [Kibdelosporangium banguiense]|uniref:DNA-binding SARP family transcriptional activator/Flp pilus assembly protein TadD n=1 Tax=Kibdelosporangium banguiense TaxID=1365924 RepID=A0ABS4TR07_9PSEU|nr:BTAD domain-containing putative transcriptional regulator [Kibdelosporangium banguiense]MBP2326841.1 DNA-binding SARP family transcriptional activator/Flp pilus assembly protein TadD [Kibdelosporangium banguiense]